MNIDLGAVVNNTITSSAGITNQQVQQSHSKTFTQVWSLAKIFISQHKHFLSYPWVMARTWPWIRPWNSKLVASSRQFFVHFLRPPFQPMLGRVTESVNCCHILNDMQDLRNITITQRAPQANLIGFYQKGRSIARCM